ncbi:Serine/Threonine kinase domain protein (macronuclear) [Tetrahymena thermophila SB210]|uniref:Serine/Threonine kinase domain protein n=1 Tax=Tetrahymena thermophila (strain SB210) TaxID=312017 RepID=A4VDX8_TETTS|nr:Serine/Threonine kinase domain protein [Tetrahymena thermophila SB210]EDK31740.2 Serine/Threonine kinase domain protein [Tetrahymena thermophila SB210]|eukprot:XP_001471347.2 Serine/Threonine kinase domain protein [Tetrahymena thermophila SB210]
MIYQDDYELEQEKIIFVQRNGDLESKKISKVVLKSGITFLDIQIKVQRDLKLGYTENFRLFNREGVEMFENDIPFLQNNCYLLASMGEEYDSTSGFSQYEILQTIGEGGFGKVVLAEHKQTKEKFAIKFVNTSLIGNASDIDMVFREAEVFFITSNNNSTRELIHCFCFMKKVLKNLNHRNIVRIFNCYTLKGMEVVFIMEYLQGGELLEYVTKKGRLSELEARQFFRQIVDAIQYCHKENVIHRDLKLENILLSQSSSSSIIKIIDFGIAGVGNLNTNKLNVGSLRYMAPEVLLKQVQSLQKSIDIWSLGVILYTLVVGNLPFNGETPSEIIKKITTGSYSFPAQVEGILTDEIKDLITNILIVNPEKRFALKQIRQHEWMKLPSIQLYEKQLIYQQKLEQMYRVRDNRGAKFHQWANSRDVTLRGTTKQFNLDNIHHNQTKDQKFLQNQSPIMSPLNNNMTREQTRQNNLKEMTSQRFGSPLKVNTRINLRENTSSSLREPTKMNGTPQQKGSPMRYPYAKKLNNQYNMPLLQEQMMFAQDMLEDFKDEDEYFSKQNAVEDQIYEIKKVLGLLNTPAKEYNKPDQNQNINLPQLQPNNNISTFNNLSLLQNKTKVVGVSTIDKQEIQNTEKQNNQQPENKLEAIDIVNEQTKSEKSPFNQKDVKTDKETQEKSPRNDSSPKAEFKNNQEDLLNDQFSIDNPQDLKQDKKKDEPYYRLVYIIRQTKQQQTQGDPNLQINKGYGGIYIPQEIGFVKYTANTNLRQLQTSPHRFSMKQLQSPPKKRSLSPNKNSPTNQTSNQINQSFVFLNKPVTFKFNFKKKLNASSD